MKKHEILTSNELWKQVRIAAAKEDCSASEWIRRVIRVALLHGPSENGSGRQTAVVILE